MQAAWEEADKAARQERERRKAADNENERLKKA